jgi:hypothetical protein
MALELKKAKRSTAYLKLGISAPSGGGKTLGALLIAIGLMEQRYPELSDAERWGKIAIVDTENGSGEMYVGTTIPNTNRKIGEYLAVTLKPPFEASKYTEAIRLCKENGIEVCIIDSTTHLWSGEGGLLEQQSAAAKRSGNSYTAWRDITPQHAAFVAAMLQTPIHVIATMRAKQEYVQEKDEKSGKSSVRKLGMEPEQRKGMEYEFTTFFEIDVDHKAYGAKDRTSVFDGKYFTITPDTGKQIMEWLDGADLSAPEIVATATHVADSTASLSAIKEEIIALCKELGGSANKDLLDVVQQYTTPLKGGAPNNNPNSITDPTKLAELKAKLVDMKTITLSETK